MKMDKLYIIGNGFDCAHGLPTKYSDFRKYVVSQIPDGSDYYYYSVPESITLPDGGEKYELDDVVMYIVKILDMCGGEDWSELEAYLGDAIYDAFLDELHDVDIDNDKLYHEIYANEDLATDIRESFIDVQSLFAEWVNEELSRIDYMGKKNKDIDKIIDSKGLYLSFNYSITLEKVYGINENQICHIHGRVGDSEDKIIMGHGDDAPIKDNLTYLGAEIPFGELKRKLRKDTTGIICNHKDFFDRLSNLKKIYTYGFSFSDVDMVYVEEICRHINPQKVVWYLNSYDCINNADFRSTLERLGFIVDEERNW